MFMNAKTKTTLGAFVSAAVLALTATLSPVSADGECTNSYGATVPCAPLNLTINKQVQDPENGEYVENVTDAKFNQGNQVSFKLIIVNSSGETFHNVKITDGVPENLVIDTVDMDYVNKDGKKEYTISSDKKNVEFQIDEMPAGTTVTAFIVAKLVGTYPTDDTFCRDNWAYVKADERPDGDKNFARFCVTNKVLGTTTLPVAGVEDFIYLLPFAATGLGGIALLKKRS
jgi:uncharacterized repeat protein (TIGR01451 family)